MAIKVREKPCRRKKRTCKAKKKEMLGHVPITDPDKRRGEEKELESASQVRYHVRSGVERDNSEMKDNYGANHVRVKGHLKVLCHLMSGVLVLTAKQIFNYFA